MCVTVLHRSTGMGLMIIVQLENAPDDADNNVFRSTCCWAAPVGLWLT